MSQARIWRRRLTHRPAGLVATLLFLAQFCVSPAEGAEIFSRQNQWEATLEAAKKEGKVNIYMYRYGKVLDVFRSDYPEIRPFLLTGTGAQIITKIKAERRAGRFGGKHRYLDPDGKYVFAYLANASYAQLYYNTNLINPKEFTSYYDLLKPKWHGKIVALDPRSKTEIGGTMQFLYYNPELGP